MSAIFKFVIILAVIGATECAHAGYTHYFEWNKKPADADVSNCIVEMRIILDARKSILNTTNEMTNDALHLEFNGIGDDAHEPFVFPGPPEDNFCKTQWKPYDEVVTACLLVARDHFPSSVLSISSDGSWSGGDWNAGAKLYGTVLKRSATNPFDHWFLDDLLNVDLGVLLFLVVLAIIIWRAKRRCLY